MKYMKYGVLREHLSEGTQTKYIEVPEDIFNLIYRGDYQSVKLKLKQGIDINLRNSENRTLLHHAILYNQLKIAKLLISYGADLEAKDQHGNTAKKVVKQRYPELYVQLDDISTESLPEEILHREAVGEVYIDNSCSCIFC